MKAFCDMCGKTLNIVIDGFEVTRENRFGDRADRVMYHFDPKKSDEHTLLITSIRHYIICPDCDAYIKKQRENDSRIDTDLLISKKAGEGGGE